MQEKPRRPKPRAGSGCANQDDNFRKIFKYFKSKETLPDFSKVSHVNEDNSNVRVIPAQKLDSEMEAMRPTLYLKASHLWKVFTDIRCPGLIIIQNPFTDLGTLTWIKRCLQEYPKLPHETNISQLGVCPTRESWWDCVYKYLVRNEKNKLINQLRWATMGYHHNWATKEYSAENISPMPCELQDLCRVILNGVGLAVSKEYRAEAAIVNYYPPGTTLSPHTDISEPCKDAPLLSISFGRSAIFLIGGVAKSVEPVALYLNHGDILIMNEESRLCYHAVPRILDTNDTRYWNGSRSVMQFTGILTKLLDTLQEFGSKKGCSAEDTYVDLSQIISLDEIMLNGSKNFNCCDALDKSNVGLIIQKHNDALKSDVVYSAAFLQAVSNYISVVRINLNIRQVNKL